jgi:molybdenum cofactor guanylyltransferase
MSPGTVFAAVVLNGGRSRRMGLDKATRRVAGRPMVAWVIDASREAGALSIELLGGEATTAAAHGATHRIDPHEGSGPLGGLAEALSSTEAAVVVVLGCDLACVTANTITALVTALADDQNADVALARTTRDEPLCAAWRRSRTATAAQGAFDSGTRAVHELLATLTCARVPVDPDDLLNVNTPADLARAEVILSQRHRQPDR